MSRCACKTRPLKGNYRFGSYRWTVTKTTCPTGKRKPFCPPVGTTYAFNMRGPNLTEPYDPHPFKTRRAAEAAAKRFARAEVADDKWRSRR